MAFCEAYLSHYNKDRAARDAGYAGGQGNRIFRRFKVYLSQRQIQKEAETTKTMVAGQKEILEELIALGMANPLDYIETYEHLDADGIMQTKVRQKPLTSLTRLQAASVSNIRFKDGVATYRIPDVREKIQGLISAGRHFGMFHDKLIQEHRHLHMKQGVDLTDVGSALLEEIETKLLQVLGPEKSRLLLGVTHEGQYQDVTPKP